MHLISHQQGFTLIELLVVVSIISILAAMAGTQFVESIERADAAACQENLHTIYQALMSYKFDNGKYPLGDCTADNKPRMDSTAWGCGPAANGYWCGVPLVLATQGYCPESALYCPALKRSYAHSIEAYPSCGDSEFSGKTVPQWKFMRFAYNSAAADSGGYSGGESDIEEAKRDVWLVRCLHVDIGQFDPERRVDFPFRVKPDEENPGWTWYGEYELTRGGTIQMRAVEKRRG